MTAERVVIETEVRKARQALDRMRVAYPDTEGVHLDRGLMAVAEAQQKAIESIFGFLAGHPFFGARRR